MGYSGRVAGAFLGSEARVQHPADIDEVIGNDSETDPAMHARVTFIEAAAESVASLEHADAPFATDAPFLSFAEPALLLALSTLRTLGTERRNRDLCDSHLLRRRFVGSGEKAGVAGDHARRHAEPLLVLFNRRDQQGRVRRPFVIDLVSDDDLVFRLLDFDHLAELGGLARFSFADDFAGVFKQTDDLAGRVGDALDDPSARLAHDLLHAGKHRVELFFQALQGRLLQHVSGALDSRTSGGSGQTLLARDRQSQAASAGRRFAVRIGRLMNYMYGGDRKSTRLNSSHDQ